MKIDPNDFPVGCYCNYVTTNFNGEKIIFPVKIINRWVIIGYDNIENLVAVDIQIETGQIIERVHAYHLEQIYAR